MAIFFAQGINFTLYSANKVSTDPNKGLSLSDTHQQAKGAQAKFKFNLKKRGR